MWLDLVYAIRILKKSRLATVVSILALALGIGANIGSLITVNALLLHPFPYANLDRIVTIWGALPKANLDRAGVTAADFEDWKRQSRSFENLSAYTVATVNQTGADRPQPLQEARVGAGFFQVFGMKPRLGRVFSAGDEGNPQVAVLSYGLWKSRFGSAQDVIGKIIPLAGKNYTIAGVMPDEFDYPLATEVWIPLVLTPTEKADRVFHSYLAMGRLKPGVSAAEANTDLRTAASVLERSYPKTNEGWSASVVPLRQITESVTNRFIVVLAAASLFLLLLAGANVANIQLAQATYRRKAIVIEASLGASRLRIARSLCLQTVLLALAGGATGLLAALWINDLNRTVIPARIYQIIPGLRYLRIDSTVMIAIVALTLAIGILCSLPAILHLLGKGSSPALSESLQQGNRSVASDFRHRLRDVLVIGEIAMALLLLVGAGVMVNTFQHMTRLNLGFNPSNLLSAQISLTRQSYPNDASVTGFFDRLLGDLSTIPGVESASVEMPEGSAAQFQVEGQPDPKASDPKPNMLMVDSRYFRTIQMPMLAGRPIGEQDVSGSMPVIVVSKSIADHYWPGMNPIGRRVRVAMSPWLTVVGVSGDSLQWFTAQPEHNAYSSYRQSNVLSAQLLLRTTGDPASAERAVIAKVRALDPAEPVFDMKSVEQFYAEERSGVQGAASAMKNNAIIALFLALSGIYGVIAYFVSQRTKEIGIRIAVGAATSDIMKMTFKEAGRVAGIGLAIGVPAAYLLMRVVSSVLYGVMVVRWTTFAGVTATMAVAALLAAYFPSRRAAAVDPLVALRIE